MKTRPAGHGRAMPIALRAVLALAAILTVALAFTARADAALYKMVACSAGNGLPPHSFATNTAHAGNPAGIFEFHNWCGGQGSDPPGEHAFLRIVENQAAGNAGHGAYGQLVFDTPAHVHFKAAGGYTRQPHAFNDGWRARFWVASACCTAQIMTQGAGLPNSGGHWALTRSFAPHLWPLHVYYDFTRFVYEMQCVRAAGCDRAGYNATDLNGIVFVLSDDWTSQAGFTHATTPFLRGDWVKGVHDATFNVADLGSGIRHERLRIDGAQRWGWDHAAECNTAVSGANGEWARAYQPCPIGTHPRAIPIDTRTLADGAHALQACVQDYAQYQGLGGTASESCDQRTIRTDNTPPGAPTNLQVATVNPARYRSDFDARFTLPANGGSPIVRVRYQVVGPTGTVVQPTRTVAATDPTALSDISGPAQPGDYRLRVWLEDAVGHQGPPALAPIPRDTTPPAAPQHVSVTAPQTARAGDGFDLRWRNLPDPGAPIAAAHYQVLDQAGHIGVPTKTVSGTNLESIRDLDAPTGRGPFALRLWLSDAEGNHGAPASVPLAYRCVRSSVPGATQLDLGIGPRAAGAQVVRQGRGSTLAGRLSAGNAPTPGAPVCVFSRVLTDPGRDFLGVAMTAPDGGFSFPVAAGPSRELSAVHRTDHRELEAAATIQTIVRPTFRAVRKVVYNKQFARFRGRIPGPHNDRVVIVLQVKRGKGWLAFRRYRTRDDGRFSLRYRFNRTFSPSRYLMRAQVRHTVGYPYLQGNSRRLKLTVRPRSRRSR